MLPEYSAQTDTSLVRVTNHCNMQANAYTNSEGLNDGEMIFAQTLCRGTLSVGARRMGSWYWGPSLRAASSGVKIVMPDTTLCR